MSPARHSLGKSRNRLWDLCLVAGAETKTWCRRSYSARQWLTCSISNTDPAWKRGFICTPTTSADKEENQMAWSCRTSHPVMPQWSATGHKHTSRHTWMLGWGPAHASAVSLLMANSGKMVSCERRGLFTSVVKINKVWKSSWGGGVCSGKKFPPSPLSTLAMFSWALLDLRLFLESALLFSLLPCSHVQGRLYLPKLRNFRETTCCILDHLSSRGPTEAAYFANEYSKRGEQ